MHIVPLGTNGFFSSFDRQTACFVIRHGETLIVLDAGSGLFRFAEPVGEKLLSGVTGIHLYLSHYHLDHTVGFYAAFKLFHGKKVRVFGKTDKKVFSELPDQEYFGIDFAQHHQNFTWTAIAPGKHAMNDYAVAVRKQHHNGAGSLAFRFSFSNKQAISYVTDSEPNEDSVAFCQGSDLLLHEHYLSGHFSSAATPLSGLYEGGHTTTVGAASVAKSAGVKRLALIHHHPLHDNRQLEDQLSIAKNIFAKTRLAHDLRTIEV